MRTNKELLSAEPPKYITCDCKNSSGIDFFKMNSSNSDCEQNSVSVAYSDSGYLTNYNHESQSLSTNSSGMSSEELYPQIKPEITVENNMYFCENAVFDEPKLEGPPILSEDISINLNKFIQPITDDRTVSLFSEKFNNESNNEYENYSASTIIENSSSNNTNEIVFDSLKLSAQKAKRTIIKDERIDDSELETMKNNRENINNDLCRTEDCIEIKIEKATTPNKPVVNPINLDLSPDLFSDEDETDLTPEIPISAILECISQTQKPIVQNEQMLKNDRRLLRRVQEALGGLPPPPSVTILQTTVADMLNKINSNKHLFLTNSFETENGENKENERENKKEIRSLLIVNNKEEIDSQLWPEILNCRYHGLHYNRTKISEDFEHYCTKYATRYVGVETASSCTVWSTTLPNSATKKRNNRLRWAGMKSPGRRLSHLARRRITFSSSNLQASCSSTMSVIGSANVSTKQLVIDARKNTTTVRRRSPRKSPKKLVRTPNSGSKKPVARKLIVEDDPKQGSSRVVSTKRALFQSPENTRSTASSTSSDLTIPSNVLSRNKSRRNLFISPRKSPNKNKNSPMKNNCDSKKRKRPEEECHPNKFPRSLSYDNGSYAHALPGGSSLVRRHSEMSVGSSSSSTKGELSDLHKKKLIWAVSEALRSQQIGMSHPKFRTFASILCKVVKHLVPDLLSNGPRQPGSTSDRMLRIAKQHVFAVTRGKSYDEVIQQAKEANENLKNLRQPTGYVPLDNFKSEEKKRHDNILQDKVMNIENNQSKNSLKSPDYSLGRDENNKARIKRQILFDDVDNSKSLNTSR